MLCKPTRLTPYCRTCVANRRLVVKEEKKTSEHNSGRGSGSRDGCCAESSQRRRLVAPGPAFPPSNARGRREWKGTSRSPAPPADAEHTDHRGGFQNEEIRPACSSVPTGEGRRCLAATTSVRSPFSRTSASTTKGFLRSAQKNELVTPSLSRRAAAQQTLHINSTPPALVPAFHFLPTRSADRKAKASP